MQFSCNIELPLTFSVNNFASDLARDIKCMHVIFLATCHIDARHQYCILERCKPESKLIELGNPILLPTKVSPSILTGSAWHVLHREMFRGSLLC